MVAKDMHPNLEESLQTIPHATGVDEEENKDVRARKKGIRGVSGHQL